MTFRVIATIEQIKTYTRRMFRNEGDLNRGNYVTRAGNRDYVVEKAR